MPHPAIAHPAAGEHRARVAPVDPRRAGPLARIAQRVFRRRLGKAASPLYVAARSPWTLRGMIAYEYAIDRARALDVRLEDAAVMRAAEVVHCDYCMDIGRAILLQRGVPRECVEAVARGDGESLGEAERVVLRYAEAMSATPVAVDDELVAALRRHLGDEQVVELTAAIAWENHRARFNAALGIAPQGFTAACSIPPAGARVQDGSSRNSATTGKWSEAPPASGSAMPSSPPTTSQESSRGAMASSAKT